MALKWIALSTAVALVTGGWTAGWFYVRGEVADGLDRAFVDLRSRGVEVDCPERALAGWPFRIDLFCTRPTATLPDGTRLAAEALRAVTVVTDPRLVVIELDPPLRAAAPTGDVLTAGFTLFQSSVRVEDADLGRLSVAVDGLDLDVGKDGVPLGGLRAERAEAHFLPVESDAADRQFAVSLKAARPDLSGAEVLPAPTDAELFVTIDQAAVAAASPEPLRAFAAAGGSVEVHQARLALGGTTLSTTGTARLAPTGEIAGDLQASGTGLQWLTEAAKEGKPVPPALATLGSAFLLLGRPVADGARQIDVTIDAGNVTANGLALGAIPPLF